MTLSNEDQQLALTLTGIPTAAGLEDRVIEFLEGWLFMRSARLRVQRDDGGNLLITQRGAPRGVRWTPVPLPSGQPSAHVLGDFCAPTSASLSLCSSAPWSLKQP
jgi:hypothetical protein